MNNNKIKSQVPPLIISPILYDERNADNQNNWQINSGRETVKKECIQSNRYGTSSYKTLQMYNNIDIDLRLNLDLVSF